MRERGGKGRRDSAFGLLDNFTLLTHVMLLRSTIGAAHAMLKQRARRVFNGDREKENVAPSRFAHYFTRMIMSRTDNFPLTCLDRDCDLSASSFSLSLR